MTDARMEDPHIVVLRLTDNRVRFVTGQSATAREEHATRYGNHAAALKQAERALKWAGVKDAWPSLAPAATPR